MKIQNFYPTKGHFLPEETATFNLVMHLKQQEKVSLQLDIFHLAERIFTKNWLLELNEGEQIIPLTWTPPAEVNRGYGIKVRLLDQENMQTLHTAFSAFDVLLDWVDFPRYGFLSDFNPQRPDPKNTLKQLLPFHINGLQFYDWQYRHDKLVPENDLFIDPLGRKLSLTITKQLIKYAHDFGMAAMPYLAVYAASIDFWRNHQDWGLFDEQGKAHTFEDFLGLMDPSPGSPWTKHLLDECLNVTNELAFDGYHVDQYGEPKQAFNINKEEVDIPLSFVEFIQQLKNQSDNRPVVFNAVKNWPIDALADSKQDFMYIEVWPPTPTYEDLREIVLGARQKSGNKPVVIAQYLHNDQIANIRLSNAVIMSCGGTRIELGEQSRLLSDPYFPKHESISADLQTVLLRSSDFAVRYEELNGPKAEHINLQDIHIPDNVMAIGRKSENFKTINLINFSNLTDPKWTETHSAPESKQNMQIKLPFTNQVKQVYWASPDSNNSKMQPCPFHFHDNQLRIDVPILNFWTMIAIELT
ncbi:MAG: hypothetical protein JEZ06_04300 [Anaerolineaceae bacterium]|nr:hypothetical protein [Anaerolineaceae bacterium]